MDCTVQVLSKPYDIGSTVVAIGEQREGRYCLATTTYSTEYSYLYLYSMHYGLSTPTVLITVQVLVLYLSL